MSTTHAPIPVPRQSDAPANTDDKALHAPAAAECPSCGACVRNICVQPGETIRCLNCGARFTPVLAAGHKPIAAGSGEESPSATPIREPQSAGYWFLRIPAMIAAVASVLLYIGMTINVGTELINPYYRSRGFWQDVLPFVVLPLFPLAGFFLFAVTRALARVESGAIKAAWRIRLLKSPLPSAPGSSLPYIVPIAVGPTLIVLVLMVSEYNQRRDLTIALAALFEFPIFFLLGFICDNLRQFFWRQQALAAACGGSYPSEAPQTSGRRFPMLALMLALMAIAGSGVVVCLLIAEYQSNVRWGGGRHPYDEYRAIGLLAATILALGVTLFLLARNFQRAIDAWWRAALGEGVAPATRDKGRAAQWAIGAPFYLYCAACLWMVAKLIIDRDGPTTDMEICALLLGAVVGALACFALPRLYADVRSWRRAQMQFWAARKVILREPRLPRLAACAVYATMIFSVFSAAAFLLDGWQYARGMPVNHFLVEYPLMSVLICLPAILIALLSREFMLADRMAVELQKNAEEQQATQT